MIAAIFVIAVPVWEEWQAALTLMLMLRFRVLVAEALTDALLGCLPVVPLARRDLSPWLWPGGT
ncbi:hypothetical protein [Streptomyces sp. NPDC048603]|uniref:hypothetical protein n=1 Tax=Streptomyces sp. NPDC048603 TaxID=3365577 RepID=UPI0037193004